MDFNLGKPSHIFALILLIFSFFLFFILPIYSFIVIQRYQEVIENVKISESIAVISQIIVMSILIIVPFFWYYFVNRIKFRDIFIKIKLVRKNIDNAFLLGILAAGLVFILIFLFEILLLKMGQKPSDLSNIPDIEKMFSPVIMFLIVSIQPIGEEIFFRGFLYEKTEGLFGYLPAIIITAVLFGIAHMEYGKIFPVIMPIIMGLVLGFIVYKTRNLYSAIIAHVTFNVTSLFLAYLGQKLLENLTLSL